VAQKQGVGKSSLLVLLSRIFATNSQENICLSHNNLATFCGRFNAELSTNLWVALEELKADRKKFDSFLKDFVSNSHILLEKKGQDRVFVSNYSTCLLFSNDLNVTRVDSLDRRQVFYECSDACRNDADFFSELYQEFDDPRIMKAIFMFLLSLDLSKWDYRVFPETQTRRKLQNISKNINHRFAEFILQTDLRDRKTLTCDRAELFMLWQQFIEDEGVVLCSKRDRNYVCNSFEISLEVVLENGVYHLERAHLQNKLKEFKIFVSNH
jgi:phage/plasmid-associated DNA primase